MNEDLRELLRLLRSHGVEFVVIGAHAVGFYSRPRMTQDLDLFVGRTKENARRLREALKEFGADIGEQGAKSFFEKDRQMIRIGAPPNLVDILNFAGDDPFDEVFQQKVEGKLDGEPASFPSKAHLIEMKRASGRKQDLADIERLTKPEEE